MGSIGQQRRPVLLFAAVNYLLAAYPVLRLPPITSSGSRASLPERATSIGRLCLTRVGRGRPFGKGGAGEMGWMVVSLHLRAGLASLVHPEGRPA
jgi:hypothetical protein